MAHMTIEFRSSALNKSTKVRVIYNQDVKPPYPTFYLLHGLSDDESIWTRRTSIERYAEKYPFMFIMPDGARSWYCDSRIGNYESYIAKELVTMIDQMFPTRRQARYRAIGGLSMGGYGALKLGLKYPRTFGSITAHSSAIGFMRWADNMNDIPEVPVIVDGIDRAANDPYELVTRIPADKRPHIYFDCGRKDFLIKDNEAFHAHLTEQHIPHVYQRFAGEHTWAYWDLHIQDALKQHASVMGL